MSNDQIHRDCKKTVQHAQSRDGKTDNRGRPERDFGKGGDAGK
jgi:hypothetical protein